jgi:hypothetical protein
MTESTAQEKDEIREVVRQRYAAAATKVTDEAIGIVDHRHRAKVAVEQQADHIA